MHWGVATAGHQVEGGLSDDWSIFESDPAIRDKVRINAALGHLVMNTEVPGPALRHSDLSELTRDLDRAVAIGCTAYRFSVEWSRVEPTMGGFSTALTDYYLPAVLLMMERGLEPYITLSHLTLPRWVLTPSRTTTYPLGGFVETLDSDAGFLASMRGWENPNTISAFVAYVDLVVTTLSPAGARHWFTLNEPVGSVVSLGYFASVWSPGFLGDFERGKKVYFNLLRAHVAAFRRIKFRDPAAQVGFAHNMMSIVPLGADPDPARRFEYFYNDHFLNSLATGVVDTEINADLVNQVFQQPNQFFGTVPGAPWVRPFDFIGINYYYKARVYWDVLIGVKGGKYTGGKTDPDQSAQGIIHHSTGLLTGLGWEVHPDGLRALLTDVASRFVVPLVVSEFGMSEPTESLRAPHLVAHAAAIEAATAAGVDVRASFYWTISDNFEWTNGYDPRAKFGLFSVDRARDAAGQLPLNRSMTDSALAFRALASGGPSDAVGRRFGQLAQGGDQVTAPDASPTATYNIRLGGVPYLLVLFRPGRPTRDMDALVYSFLSGTWFSAAVRRWNPSSRELTIELTFPAAKPTTWRITLSSDLQAVSGTQVAGPQIVGQRVWWDGTFAGSGWHIRIRLVPVEQPLADPRIEMRLRRPGRSDWITASAMMPTPGQFNGTVNGVPFQASATATSTATEPDCRLRFSNTGPLGLGLVPLGAVLDCVRLPDEVMDCPSIEAISAAPGAPVDACVTGEVEFTSVADTDGWIFGAGPNRTWSPIQNGRTIPGGWVSGASRHPGQLDYVTIGTDGHAYTAARDENGTWGGWWALPPIKTRPGAVIVITSPKPDELSVTAADGTGRILRTVWPSLVRGSPRVPPHLGWAQWKPVGG